ncbi:hypothetical protein GWI33_012718, partial [Rhynchophorus ferrugineus]
MPQTPCTITFPLHINSDFNFAAKIPDLEAPNYVGGSRTGAILDPNPDR